MSLVASTHQQINPSQPMYDVAELPGGRLVCALHAAPVCHRCGVDFSFTWEDSDEEEVEDGSQEDEEEDEEDDDDEIVYYFRTQSWRTVRNIRTEMREEDSDVVIGKLLGSALTLTTGTPGDKTPGTHQVRSGDVARTGYARAVTTEKNVRPSSTRSGRTQPSTATSTGRDVRSTVPQSKDSSQTRVAQAGSGHVIRCGVIQTVSTESTRPATQQSGRTTSMTGYRESTPHDTPNTPSRILPNLPRGTGRTFPSEFTPWPETVTPMELFSRRRQVGLFTRLVHRGDPQACLVFTDGACLGNGGANPRAGWAFVHGKSGKGRNATYHIVQNRLERTGVFGVGRTIQTSNRAELRAVIAALRFNNWRSEGFRRLVIATDSEYVVEGATNWARSWVRRGWCTRTGDPVKNKDLWELLLGQVERSRSSGLEVELWRVPREWNEVADEAAKEAAAEGGAPLEFHDVVGLEFLWNAG